MTITDEHPFNETGSEPAGTRLQALYPSNRIRDTVRSIRVEEDFRVTEQQWKPGWYRNGEDQERWWDGRAWTDYTRPRLDSARQTEPITVQPPRAVKPADVSKVTRRPASVAARPRGGVTATAAAVIAAGTGGAALVLGLVIGVAAGAGSAIDPTTSTAYVSLQSKLTAMTKDRDRLQGAAPAAAASTSNDDQDVLDQERTALDARASALDDAEAKLAKRVKKVAAREAAVKKAAAKAKKPSTSTASSSSSSSGGGSVYYENCAAARAAGAAPVRRVDPGYAAHLDRDGDGVGCE